MNKQFLLTITLLMSCISANSQIHKLNLGFDLSYGTHYYNQPISNPFMGSLSLSYGYDFCQYAGVAIGATGGGFMQYAEFGNAEFKQRYGLHEGVLFAPFIASKLYYDIIYNEKLRRSHYLFLESKFLFAHTRLNKSSTVLQTENVFKKHITYEIKLGYEYPINDNCNMYFCLGYNSFDFSVINPSEIKYKNSTPLQLGLGLCYLIGRKH